MKISTRKIVFTGLMAAVVFVSTYLLYFNIPTPTGPVMLKTGNIFCLLAGILLGGPFGGIAAGLGSMIFDLLNPLYISGAPFTLIRFFIMGCVCGLVANAWGKKGGNIWFNYLGALLGALINIALYIAESVYGTVLAGSGLWAAVIGMAPKILVSSINGVIAVIIAPPLGLWVKRMLKRAKMEI